MNNVEAKLQNYFYEERAFSSRSVERKFPKVHKIVKYILDEMPNKGTLYTDIGPLTKKLNKNINDPKEGAVKLPKTVIDDVKVLNIIGDMYADNYVDKPINKILVMYLKESKIDFLKKDLTFVVVPKSSLSDDKRTAAYYDSKYNAVIFFLHGMEAARSTKQVQQIITGTDRESNKEILYHELIHFVQEYVYSRRLFKRITYFMRKYIGINIRKKYEDDLDEIEAYSFGAVLFYLQNKNIKQFVKDVNRSSFSYRVVNYDKMMKDIYKSMNKASKRKSLKLIKSFSKRLVKDKKLLLEIIKTGDIGEVSTKFEDRLIKALEEEYNIILEKS